MAGLRILIVEDQFIEASDLRQILERAGHSVCGIAASVREALAISAREKPDFVLVDIFLKGDRTGIDLAVQLHRDNIPFVFLSANSTEATLAAAKATHPYGFLVKPFRERDILAALDIAVYRHASDLAMRSRQERVLSGLLTGMLQEGGGPAQKCLRLARAFLPFVPFDYIFIDVDRKASPDAHLFGCRRVDFDECVILDMDNFLGQTRFDAKRPDRMRYDAALDREMHFLNGQAYIESCGRDPLRAALRDVYGFTSLLWLPLYTADMAEEWSMSITFWSCQAAPFGNEHLELLRVISDKLAKAIEGFRRPGPKYPAEVFGGVPGKDELFPNIVGRSPALLHVFDQVAQAAPFETSVLIIGETGTGKEGLVSAIHALSPRKNGPLIRVNCAAIPPTLIESELFGHEKGSFTDATERRLGKFELAHGGTIFLDEIGEIPPEIQVKLLRVLQEKEIERIGGETCIYTDVRVIAATNRDLEKEMAAGNFRLDLYYRIHVFPIYLPPLRERKSDIPLLVEHFITKYTSRHGFPLKTISERGMQQLLDYPWPGNIRELEHLIERHMLMSRTPVIDGFSLPAAAGTVSASGAAGAFAETAVKTVEEVERDHILDILRRCNGRISGRGGAAELLNIPPTTLSYRIKKLGIVWQHS